MRWFVGPVVLFVVVATLAGAAVATPVAQATDSPTPDDTVITVDVAPDGDATWTIAYRFRLDDENATAAFDSFQNDIRANRSRYEQQFAERLRPTVAGAANATGRSMTLRNVSVTTNRERLPAASGVVSYRFEWRSFAAGDGDRLRVGDAIDGLYLSRGTTLVIDAPDGWTVRSAAPEPGDRRAASVTWSGPLSFDDGAPRVVVSPTLETTVGTSPPSTAVGIGGLPWIPILALLLILAGGIAVWYRRRDDGPPSELLSDAERVRELVERNDGRMKQAAVADALDWTDAKTSRVVNGMQDVGELDVFRIGRENVVTLPDEDDAE